MEPLHITEFASKRYYEKLEQLPRAHHHEPQQQQTDSQATEASASTLPPATRQVEQHGYDIVPRYGEHLRLEKEKEKRGLFGRLRSSKTNVHTPDPQILRRPSIVSVASGVSAISLGDSPAVKRRSLPLDQLFWCLPTELQVHIVRLLPLSDVLNLRLASRKLHTMVTMNELPIVRYQLKHAVPAYAKRLYPVNDASGYDLHYLCGLWHRLHVAAKLAGRMCDWCTKEIFLKTTKEQVAAFAAQRERIYRRLIPLLFTLFHFFENYRRLHVQFIQEHGYGVERSPYTLNPIEVQIMNMYDDRTLLKVHQVFPMVVASFCRQMRPPSYVGRVERTIRGYLREKPADEVNVSVLCLGGLRQVLRLWEVKGYNTRVGSVEAWYSDIKGPKESTKPAEALSKDAKPRRGIMSLGRKRSTWHVRDAAKVDDAPPPLPSRGSLERVPTTRDSMNASPRHSLVFQTSLAAGMPMDRLEPEQTHQLLSDLPALQRLWLTTAEALILERGIVKRPVDIKRNAQVMLDLIKEDGVVEEDIWWYGMGATQSIRPPELEAIEDDPIS